ncbi:MAG TPA: tRNA (adenosine(37)-N6)-threonylcarbamoyltransferase complex transferase subunit TsaD [Candidatus Paceibacterota bacterium]|nr:tRNA (adenosine(37)-N6)-threonylcarbamoyltransferase complex transferase subunit TsaD [Candidatus Paceibacterota bacterium]
MMKILAIETSCDETAVSILEGIEKDGHTAFTILGNALLSQIDIHKEYGGVFPALAKRAHAENLVPLLAASLEEAELLREDTQALSEEMRTRIGEMLVREPELADALFAFITEAEVPDIDAIAVTYGPGLEPALWVGVNLARALSVAWNKPIVGVNHLEGHILSSLLVGEERTFTLTPPSLPLVSLVISGGHTELVVTTEWSAGTARLAYKKIGETRDDAVGEAYDKVARMMGLLYPGGPEVSRLAEEAREAGLIPDFSLPRPMIDADNLDFSFSGLKTAVLYLIKEKGELSEDDKRMIAREFETAVADVLWKKTEKALAKTAARSLLIGGGVSANHNLRQMFAENAKELGIDYSLPHRSLTGDNAIMIAVAGYYRAREKTYMEIETLRADGNLSLS